MDDTRTVRYEQEIMDVLQAIGGTHRAVATMEGPSPDGKGLDARLRHLIHIRASQINGCAHCLRMHLKEARQDGETQDRLDRIVAWRHSSDFDETEKAVLAWTEALTTLEDDADLGAIRARLRRHFSERQIGLLAVEIGMINFWNRVNVSRH